MLQLKETSLYISYYQEWILIAIGKSTPLVQPLNSKTISNAEIKLPSLEEQKKIGIPFKQLDNLIILHRQKIDKLKQLKQGLLQQMFI